MRVVIEKEDGFLEVRDVPPEAVEMDKLDWGVIVGPPDLSKLDGLKREEKKAINSALVQRGLLDWSSLRKRRGELMAILKSVLQEDKVRDIYIQIIDLYEQRWVNGD